MNWPLPMGAHLLAPFDHQVAGQSSMLRYDETTVCKPLIAREHFVYQTLPEGLKEFTPEYRGELEVGLAEKDGYLQLYGLCVKDDSNEDVCQCSLLGNQWEEPPAFDAILGKEDNSWSSRTSNLPSAGSELTGQNRCVIRVLRSGSYEICSPSHEGAFSNSNAQPVKTPSLNPWSLKNHKRLLDKMRKGKHRHNSFRCILLKNVVADFKYPCILDLKVGSRLHGDEAIPAKVESQSKKCAETTSNTIGVRLCGMQVFQKNTGLYINLDKYQGRMLTDETFKRTLENFLHNGIRYRSELLQPIVSKLSSLIECLRSVNTYKFYASSLLIIYDGLEDGLEKGNVNDRLHWNVSSYDRDKNIINHDHEQNSKLFNGHDPWSSSPNRFRSEDVLLNTSSWKDGHEMNGHVEMLHGVQNKHTDLVKSHPSLPSIPSSCPSDKDSVHSATSCNDKQNICDSNSVSSPSTYKNKSENGVKSHSNQCSHQFPPQKHSCSNSNSADSSGKDCISSERLPVKVCNHSSVCSVLTDNHKIIHNSLCCSSGISNQNTTNAQHVYKVDVKMIDFAHTTHQGFPNDKCRHEGPDMDYINGLTNLMKLFENLMAEC